MAIQSGLERRAERAARRTEERERRQRAREQAARAMGGTGTPTPAAFGGAYRVFQDLDAKTWGVRDALGTVLASGLTRAEAVRESQRLIREAL